MSIAPVDNAAATTLEDQIRVTKLMAFDFDGVFTDNTVYVFQDGREAVKCYRGDGIGLEKLKRLGIETIIISAEENPVVSARARKLGVACIQGSHDKLAALQKIISDSGYSWGQVAFVGNDVNDLDCLARVGLPIVVRDAHPDVVHFGQYQTRAAGGAGAVREICDLFWRVISKSPIV